MPYSGNASLRYYGACPYKFAVSGDGVVVRQVKSSEVPDEIGDLSRSFHTIINRLDGYTRYLQSLGSRLSHELRTPLSVVSTSLESIDKSGLDGKTRKSIERAELGAERLKRLIRNLSEASSVEKTIEMSATEPVDLADWLKAAKDVYSSLYVDREIVLRVEKKLESAAPQSSTQINASVELLHQMMDKLMSNTVDFSSVGSAIIWWLDGDEKFIHLSVENTGSQLPVSKDLFAPMVSIRESHDDQPHMGFGLHIVKLIADFHNARCNAENITQRNAVRFTVSFPRS